MATNNSNNDILGLPLLKDSINTLARIVFFWTKDIRLGELVEQWAVLPVEGGKPINAI